MQAGAVNIKLLADITDLQGKMQQAERSVGGAMSGIGKSISSARSAFAALGLAVSVGAMAKWIKGAIDAADETSKLAQKIGVSVDQVAGLQLAFRQSGVEATQMIPIMAKLGVAMVNGSKAFDAMGVSGRRADGTLKGTRDVLGEVADKFAGYQDGAAKTALAVSMFGEEGAKLLPLLNGGSKALDDYDAMARKLGLTLTEETVTSAEKFNDTLDLIGQAGTGMSRQIATQLLPTLTGLAGQFFDSMTAGDGLQKTADFLASTLKVLYIGALGVVEIFTSLGSVLGGVTAALVAAATGDFRMASNILKEMTSDIGGGWTKTIEQMGNAWTATGSESVEAMTAMNKAGKEAAVIAGEAAAAAKKATEEFEKLRGSITAKETGFDADYVKNLTLIAVEGKKAGMAIGEIVSLQEAYIKTQPYSVALAKETADALKVNTDANNELISAELKRIEQIEATLPAMLEANKTLREEAELLGLSESAQLQVTQARQASVIAIKEEQLARMQNSQFMSREQIALEYEIALLKERMGLTQAQGDKNIAVTQANEATAAWQKTADEINQGLTDSLFRAFESGKGFFQTLWDGIKNLFKTTVLRMLITPVTSGITGMLGMGGAANAGGMGGSSLTSSIGIVDTVSKVYSAVTGSFAALGDSVAFAAQDIGAWLVTNTTGTLNSFGSSLMGGSGGLGTMATGLAAAAAGIAIGSLIAGDKVLIGLSGTASSAIGAAIGFAVGGPLGAVIGGALGGVANAAFGMGPQRTTASGISGTFGSEGASGLQNYQSWSQKGGLFRSNKSGTNYSSLDAGASEAINSAVIATGNAVRAYATVIGLSADAVSGFSQSINVSLMGLSAEDANAAVGRAIGNFGEAMASAAYGAALQAFRLAEETNTEALSRLATDLTSVNTAFRTMGKTLMAASLAGADASSKLIAMAGGLEDFTTQTNAYYSAFYTQTERTKNATRQLTDTLYFMGLELPATRDAFRELVDAQDLMTDAGRATYSVLIALAPAFDEITTSSAALEAELASLASSTATSLIAAFTGRGLFMPSLNATALALATVSTAANTTTGALSSINSILGDASSRVLYFGSAIGNVGAPLDAAQLATLALRDEMIDLSVSASGTTIDFEGLTRALENVDTRTFVATVTGVFEVIGQRIRDVLSGIADERISVRDAAINIIGAGGLTAAQISQQIAAAMVGMPNNNGVMAAQSALSAADARVAATAAAAAAASGAYGNALGQQNAAAGAISNRQNEIAGTQAAMGQNRADFNSYAQNAVYQTQSYNGQSYATRWEFDWVVLPNMARLNGELTALGQTLGNQQGSLTALNASYNASVANANAYAAASAAAAATAGQATTAQTAAATAAKAAQLAYIASLQQYAVDAGKAVKQLSQLRQETVNYFQTQKQLADLMNSSASSLRQTVADYRFGLMDPRDQLAQLQERFNVAYSMALSTSGDVLAGYGSEINALINPLLQKAQEAGLSGSEYASLISTTLARADSVAARLEAMAPADYQLESLALLAQIDATLAALETGALTADQIVVNAIKAGSDTTANGLRAVIAAITGGSIPAFAAGGYHAGGMRLVGENGPEMEATGPSRIYNASQTRGMFAGGSDNTEVVAELRALRQDNASMRSELQAIASFTNKSAKLLDRWDGEGAPVRNAIGETFAVETTATTTAGA